VFSTWVYTPPSTVTAAVCRWRPSAAYPAPHLQRISLAARPDLPIPPLVAVKAVVSGDIGGLLVVRRSSAILESTLTFRDAFSSFVSDMQQSCLGNWATSLMARNVHITASHQICSIFLCSHHRFALDLENCSPGSSYQFDPLDPPRLPCFFSDRLLSFDA
jgi:hypothetical protein